MASTSCLVNGFSEILELKRSLVEGQQLQQIDRKKRKGESEKKKDKKMKSLRWKDSFSFNNYLQTFLLLRMLEQKSRQT